jgi:hypothetical protein
MEVFKMVGVFVGNFISERKYEGKNTYHYFKLNDGSSDLEFQVDVPLIDVPRFANMKVYADLLMGKFTTLKCLKYEVVKDIK